MKPRPLEIADSVRQRHPRHFAIHIDRGQYFCPWTDREKPKFGDMVRWQTSRNPYKAEKAAERPIPPDPQGLEHFLANTSHAKVLWLGHASFLIEVDGFRCLVDPVYGVLGRFVKRFSAEPFAFADLPSIDAVFLTHGHYDHLDVETLHEVAEAHPEAAFVAPRGQARYFPKSARPVAEVDWWEALDFGGVEAIFVPAQHWHRRGPLDYNKALWGGWIFRGTKTVFHAGDSGYFDGYVTLGELFDVDTALLPVGAYEPRWFMKSQHMNPEEALQAFADLGATTFVAMHWGTYDLTDEPRNLGGSEVRRLATETGVADRIYVPAPGGFVAG